MPINPSNLNTNHPRLMEFFVDNPNFEEPTSMMLFLNIETEISYILSINQSFSLLCLTNGHKFVLYGNGKIQNTRYVYGLTRSLSGKHVDFFSDKIIRPSLFYHYQNMKFEADQIHIDNAQIFGVLHSFYVEKAIEKFEKNDEAIDYIFGNKDEYMKEKAQIEKDRKNLSYQLRNFANLDSFYDLTRNKKV